MPNLMRGKLSEPQISPLRGKNCFVNASISVTIGDFTKMYYIKVVPHGHFSGFGSTFRTPISPTNPLRGEMVKQDFVNMCISVSIGGILNFTTIN
jgi:hypothetical protein